MPEARFSTELLKAELRQPARDDSPNLLTNLVRGVWSPFRRLIAELRAFPVRVARIDGSLVARAYLPGIQKDEVRVEVTDDLLVIEADPKRDKSGPYFTAGRRLIPLQESVKVGLAKAELKNGVLTVSLPVLYPKRHQRVPVECGENSPLSIESLMSANDRILPLR